MLFSPLLKCFFERREKWREIAASFSGRKLSGWPQLRHMWYLNAIADLIVLLKEAFCCILPHKAFLFFPLLWPKLLFKKAEINTLFQLSISCPQKVEFLDRGGGWGHVLSFISCGDKSSTSFADCIDQLFHCAKGQIEIIYLSGLQNSKKTKASHQPPMTTSS